MGICVAKDGNLFNYQIIENNYVSIIGYEAREGALQFIKGDDGRCRHFIQVPEQIDGFPVLTVDFFTVKLKMYGDDGYRHDGSSVIEVRLPEYTEFQGFSPCFTDGGYFNPAYRATYYKRQSISLLTEVHGGFVYFAKTSEGDTCSVVRIVAEDEKATELRMPDALCGYEVASIEAKSTYMLPKALKAVKIADGAVKIGAQCFRDLPCLETVHLGKDTRVIGENAFSFYSEGNEETLIRAKPLTVYYHNKPLCAKGAFRRRSDLWLEEYDVRRGWVKIGETPVYYNVNLVSCHVDSFQTVKGVLVKYTGSSEMVTIPEGVFEIGDLAFSENKFLKTIVLPIGVQKIGAFAFSGCLCLTEVVIPDSVKSIGEGAFKNCIALKELRLPLGIKVVQKGICEGCVGLTDVYMPQTLEEIREQAFEGCLHCKAELPDGIKRIGYRAFAGCNNIKRGSIPENVQMVDIFAFD